MSNRGFHLKLREGKRRFVPSPALMEVVNVTPDSFYDGGSYWQQTGLNHKAIDEKMASLKANPPAFVDVGGESSRPGAEPVPAEKELERVLPAIRHVASLRLPSLLSIDTTKPEVAKKALENGADLINDTSAGLDSHGKMLSLAGDIGVPIVLMHRKGTPKTMQDNPNYDDVVDEVFGHLEERVQAARGFGLDDEQIIIDPGIGFGKTTEHNLLLLRSLRRFKGLGLPVLVGASMKRLLSDLTSAADVNERLFGSVGLQLAAAWRGADILRTHHGLGMRQSLDAFAQVAGSVQ